VFLIIMFIDWEHKLILNKVTYPTAVVALVILAVDSFLPRPGLLSNLIFLPELSILSGVIGGAIGFVFFLIVFLINPRGMGMGDIKLACLIGLVTGFPLAIIALLIGIIIGGLVAVILLLLRIKGRKDVIPYGTFLALGPMATLLWGKEILNWYLGLF
jgi:leader peptidase (prepilin peptidase)/N-methyltransferase